MYLRYNICLVALLFFYYTGNAQRSITLMHYNLLYYGKHTGFCDASNNSVADKQQYLREILDYVRPDIFTVNELDGDGSDPLVDDATHLLNHTLNVNGVDHYRKASFPEAYLTNTLFYNTNKLKMYSIRSIPLHLGGHEKIFNAYTFYHNASHLSQSADTTFLTCFVLHLKAGITDSDALQRANEAEILTDYIDNEMPDSGNYILCGDLNVYSSDEQAFQVLAGGGSAKSLFYDPVEQTGKWHDNRKYTLYHTQSTRTEGGCFAGGGMDDRFDFILLSGSIMDSARGISYIPDSYETIGQDGEGFNSSLRISDNESVPEEIAGALYEFSDHLPVALKLQINEDPAVELSFDSIYHRPVHPFQRDSVRIYAQLTDTEDQVSSVKLRWGQERQVYTHQETMSLSGNFYSLALQEPGGPAPLYYKVNACDSTGSVVHLSGEREILFSADTTTGFNNTSDPEFKVANPVQDEMDLYFNTNFLDEIVVTIVDVAGKLRFRRLYSGFYGRKMNIPVSFLQPGVYWISVQHRNSLQSSMFIKQ